jgi:DNA-binding ferritin-like protein (Dps family)
MLHFKKAGQERVGPSWFTQAKTYQLLELTTEFFFSLLPASISHELEMTVENLSNISSGKSPNRSSKDDGISAREMKILKRVMLSLPRADLQALYKEYNQENGQLTDLERFSIYREIVGLYERAVADKKVSKDEQVSEHDLKRLKAALGYEKYKDLQNEIKDTFAKDQKDELGYKGKNIKQLDRLINNFDE